jgi:hypothetical protein
MPLRAGFTAHVGKPVGPELLTSAANLSDLRVLLKGASSMPVTFARLSCAFRST